MVGKMFNNFLSVTLTVLFLICITNSFTVPQRSFIVDRNANCFRKDGLCFQYISGSIHYFRIPMIYWDDRLKKAKASGLNTIQTYVPWNYHEEIYGMYDFKGPKDLRNFIELAQRNELLIILRIGPYIDTEWEHGGIPWWFGKSKYENTYMRTSDETFVSEVEKWWKVLFEKIKDLLYENGGPIIAIQIENEYGNYYACDKMYMDSLASMARMFLGQNVVLFTTDGYTDSDLQCGTSSLMYKTIDFGTEILPSAAFKQQRKYEPNGPLVNSEYYSGWLDYWGSIHHTKDATEIASGLDRMLRIGASVNFYMFHGGTNFGWMNGADIAQNGSFLSVPTSYDYDAPLSEAGDVTLKYLKIREVIQSYVKTKLPPVPKNTTKLSLGKVLMKAKFTFFDMIDSYSNLLNSKTSRFPETMEKMDFPYGFVVYEANLPDIKGTSLLLGGEIHDRFIIFVDKKLQFRGKRGSFNVNLINGRKIVFFIENEGRVTYADKGAHYLPDRKGILGNITANGVILINWVSYHLDENILGEIDLKITYPLQAGPLIFDGYISTEKQEDTFLNMSDWGKGQVFINNYNLGRYWSTKGPQRTLYVPKSILQKGSNRIRVFETENFSSSNRIVDFIDFPVLS